MNYTPAPGKGLLELRCFLGPLGFGLHLMPSLSRVKPQPTLATAFRSFRASSPSWDVAGQQLNIHGVFNDPLSILASPLLKFGGTQGVANGG